jgi:hypothetical protein
MTVPRESTFPEVAQWRINLMRLTFLLMATIMGSMVWYRLIYEYAGWPVDRGLAKAMLGALALMALLGVRYPLQMLPLMLYETAWKTVWIVMIALRSWLAGQWTADIEALFFDCVGIVVAYIIMPWRYVWARYVAQPMEPIFRKP